jgi:L-amino acid N-acyltransferase YncA
MSRHGPMLAATRRQLASSSWLTSKYSAEAAGSGICRNAITVATLRAMNSLIVRPAQLEDVPAMARVHVQSWKETYRGTLPDSMLDRSDFVPDRERFWTNVLTDDWYQNNPAAVAEINGVVVGIAMSGLPEEDDAVWPVQLYVHYVLAAHYGSGAGLKLLNAVVSPEHAAGLWIVDPNPRATAFYAKHGFVHDGKSKIELETVRSIRMARAVAE